jgi:hypothetical protein
MNVTLTDRIRAEESTTIEEPPSRERDTSISQSDENIPKHLIFVGKASCKPHENGVQFLRDARASGFIKYLSTLHYRIYCFPAKIPRPFANFDVYAEEINSAVNSVRY